MKLVNKMMINEPCHEKTCFCHMRTTKAQISLLWSDFLLLTNFMPANIERVAEVMLMKALRELAIMIYRGSGDLNSSQFRLRVLVMKSMNSLTLRVSVCRFYKLDWNLRIC